jgi:probable F420-dependent oxidoreductase
LIMAKRLSTLDQLSGGRVRLGIGVGWSEDEYAAVGVDFRSRGRRCDEAVRAMRELWTSETAEYEGELVRFDGVHSFPQPVGGAVPIWVGGDSEAAARRAGRLGDGYFPFGKDLEQLRALVGVARRTAEEAGRDPDAIELTALGSLRREHVAELAAIGFTRIVMFLHAPTAEAVHELGAQTREVVAGL